MLGNYLTRSYRINQSIIDLFPESYHCIPDVLLSSICAYVSLGCKDPLITKLTIGGVDRMRCACITPRIPYQVFDFRNGQ